MAALIEIFGAAVIAGIMMVSIITQSANLNQATAEKTLALNLEKNEVTLARIIESDIMKIGYHVPSPAITAIDSTGLTFLSDYTNTRTTSTVRYYLGSVLDAPAALTANPRDRLIYREVSGSPLWSAHVGIVNLRFSYYDSTGTATASLPGIRSIKVKFILESPQPYNAKYLSTSWQKTFYLRNF